MAATNELMLERLVRTRVFRHARCYAPAHVMTVLRDVAGALELAVVIDVDALERSALAKIDRVMILALDALSQAGVRILFSARYERERAVRLARVIDGATSMAPSSICAIPDPVIAISDDPALLYCLQSKDRAIALGRPELASDRITVAGETSVRATLWWLLDERSRALAA